MTALRVAASSFLNTAPLVEGFRRDRRVTFIEVKPSSAAHALKKGSADLAFVPIAEIMADASLVMIEGLGVAADGPVKSVLLRTRGPIEHITALMFDSDSRTSNLLAKLILHEGHGLSPKLVTERAASADARVVIGDKAFVKDPDFPIAIDLAEAWKKLTGIPFVFAAWATLDAAQAGEYAERCRHSLAVGEEHLEPLCESYATRLGVTVEFCRDYLTKNIHYRLNADDEAGMAEFRRRIAPAELKDRAR